MILCEFCVLQNKDKKCASGRPIPSKMRCQEFTPGIERFCSVPADYEGREQLRRIATYFGLAGKELQRVLALSDLQLKGSSMGR